MAVVGTRGTFYLTNVKMTFHRRKGAGDNITLPSFTEKQHEERVY